MTDTNSKETTDAKFPSHNAYQIRERKGAKPFWTKIGSAWAHADDQGFNIQLDCVPLDGKIVLRVVTEHKE